MGKIENGVYFDETGKPSHAGIVKIDGKIYYAGKDGVIAKNEDRIIHHGMANGLVRHGKFYFDKDGVIDLSTYKEVKSSQKSRKRSQKLKLSNKDKKIVIVVAIVFALLFAAVAGYVIYSILTNGINRTDYDVSKIGTEFAISIPEYDDEVYLCSDAMVKYYNGEKTLPEIVESGDTAYKAFIFNYKINNAESAYFRLIDINDNSTLVSDYLDLNASSYSIDNLVPNTTYKYIVSSVDLEGEEHHNEGTFKTAYSNRFISLPGVYNTRDIGGYDTLYGKKVKYGLLIRGTELDGLVESSYYLKDLKSVKQFNFQCDFDLRNSSIFNTNYVSRLGENVAHKFYNSPMYGGVFTKGSEDYLKRIFADLSDSSNYPMYMHCTYGADRTGTIVFLLQGLLGVSEDDMKAEYILTGFFDKNYANGDSINTIVSGLKGTAGKSINEKVENYLKNTIGVTQGQIDSIRSIFLED